MSNLVPFDGTLVLLPGFIAPAQQAPLQAALIAEQQWEQPLLHLFGKSHPTPRLVAWAGDHDYTYSGHTHKAKPPGPALAALWPAVEATAGAKFNTVLLNLYRTGQDSMGWHADDEPELGLNPTIASLSLGAPRAFQLRHNQQQEKISLTLPSGSLLIMGGSLQHNWQHCLPKRTKVNVSRLNLTFRHICPR